MCSSFFKVSTLGGHDGSIIIDTIACHMLLALGVRGRSAKLLQLGRGGGTHFSIAILVLGHVVVRLAIFFRMERTFGRGGNRRTIFIAV